VEVPLLLVADYANVTDNGKLNVMGIFQRLHAREFPARHPVMQLVIKLVAGPGEYGESRRLTVRLLDADARNE